jgi:hypothetical protein
MSRQRIAALVLAAASTFTAVGTLGTAAAVAATPDPTTTITAGPNLPPCC